MENKDIINKYTVAVPRYTSYPTVPYWDEQSFTKDLWLNSVIESFKRTNEKDGISLYIHLPYCENLCTYCACNKRITKNHQVEIPYINAVVKEWKLYKSIFEGKPIIKEIHLGGGTPTFFDPQNLKKLIVEILDGCEVHANSDFSFEGHPGNTTEGHLQVLNSLGFRRVSFGIQDFDEKVQVIINRKQTVEEVKNVTELARELGYTSINYDLVYGLPLQSLASLVDTINEVINLKPDRIAFYSYAHVPWVKSGQRKFTEADLPDSLTKQVLYETGRKLLLAAGYLEVGMDHFSLPSDSLLKAANDQKLHRNFMGYTHQYTELLIGLGVSSISDSWNAFAQNVKKEEDYLALINEDEFPLIKGHILTDEDLVFRKHILNIMCKGETEWTVDDLKFPDFENSIILLEELENDGLIIVHNQGFKVTAFGERFLRNICMVFDVRLRHKKPMQQIFSMVG
jgi:oxygen-independent coproporphyrinogen-3 oxidase